jgi:hypothetical protein
VKTAKQAQPAGSKSAAESLKEKPERLKRSLPDFQKKKLPGKPANEAAGQDLVLPFTVSADLAAQFENGKLHLATGANSLLLGEVENFRPRPESQPDVPCYLHELTSPCSVGGRIYRWVVLAPELRLKWLVEADTRADAIAKLRELRLTLAQMPAPRPQKKLTAIAQDIRKAKFKVAAQCWPKTVALLERAATSATGHERRELERRALDMYRVESAKNTGRGEAHYRQLARAFRGKNKMNPVDRNLALHWEDYANLSRKELGHTVRKATGSRLSDEAIRKRAVRLELATSDKVKPGPPPTS